MNIAPTVPLTMINRVKAIKTRRTTAETRQKGRYMIKHLLPVGSG